MRRLAGRHDDLLRGDAGLRQAGEQRRQMQRRHRRRRSRSPRASAAARGASSAPARRQQLVADHHVVAGAGQRHATAAAAAARPAARPAPAPVVMSGRLVAAIDDRRRPRHRPDNAGRSAAAGSPPGRRPCSSGRWSRPDTRRTSVGRVQRSQTETASRAHRGAGLRVHEGAAAERQHQRVAGQQPADHPPLAVAERVLAVAREQFGDGAAGGQLRSRHRRRGTAGRAARPAGGRSRSCRRPSARPARCCVRPGRRAAATPSFRAVLRVMAARRLAHAPRGQPRTAAGATTDGAWPRP